MVPEIYYLAVPRETVIERVRQRDNSSAESIALPEDSDEAVEYQRQCRIAARAIAQPEAWDSIVLNRGDPYTPMVTRVDAVATQTA